MRNLLKSGAAWLGGQLQAHASHAVTLSQGTTTLELVGSMAMHQYKLVSEEGFITLVKAHDWLFPAADLTVTVRNGAIITDSEGNRYQVLPLGELPCVEPYDAAGVLKKIHTKKLG